jgi:16S rRNA (adenine1518-N6/adenine1519-N6)-dimethyltransferase
VTGSRLATPSATIEVLKRHGLYTKKRLGQHFLVDDNVIERILELAAVAPDDVVVEVGPGIGTLTVALCEAAGAVVAVERDTSLVPALAETTAACPHFALVNADAVSVPPDQISAPFGPPTALVANLPYQVAATVVLRFFELLPSLVQATVMVQAEVADRMGAAPGTKAYGAYTVKLSLVASVTGRFSVAPNCFLPPPRVGSAVVRIERGHRGASEALVRDAARIADAAFAQRRKTLRNSLLANLEVAPAVIDGALARAGVQGSLRAEALPPEAFLDLARAFDTHL